MRSDCRQNLLLLMAATLTSHLILAHADARAQTDTMRLDATTGALIVDRDSTELVFNGQRYALAIRGPKLTESARASTPFVGIAYNLRSPIDIVGTYVTASPTAPADRETTTMLLQNQSGVVLRFDIKPGNAGVPASLDGLTISMQ